MPSCSDRSRRRIARTSHTITTTHSTTASSRTVSSPGANSSRVSSSGVSEAQFTADSWLFFGKETAGLPLALRERYRDRCVRLPMVSEARSLNLSNTVAVCVYEALRQNGFPGLLGTGEMTWG